MLFIWLFRLLLAGFDLAGLPFLFLGIDGYNNIIRIASFNYIQSIHLCFGW